MDALLKLFFFFFFHASFLLLLLLLSAPTTVSSPSIIGFTHSSPLTSTTGRGNGNSSLLPTLPPPQHAHPEAIAAAAVSDLRFDAVLLLSIPNGLLPFHPRSKIAMISVENEAAAVSHLPFLLPARSISVSTTFSFINSVRTAAIRPLLQFLEDANSSILPRKDIKIYEFVESDQNLHNWQQEADQLDRSSAIRTCAIALRILCTIYLMSFLFLRPPDMPYARNFAEVILLWNYAHAVCRSLLVLRETLHDARELLERDLQLGALSLSFMFTMLYAVMAAGTIVFAVAVAPKLVSHLVWRIN